MQVLQSGMARGRTGGRPKGFVFDSMNYQSLSTKRVASYPVLNP
jgi:hypothetical protein